MIQLSRCIINHRNTSVLLKGVTNLIVLRRNAGHSKWANIRHIKAAKDSQKAVTFQKLTRLIKLAIQDGGGPDPNFNLQLANVLDQARKHRMPSSTIKNAIDQTKDSKAGNVKAVDFELKGPGGSAIIVSAITDNIHKVKAHVNYVCKKYNLSVSEGAVARFFDHKGIIQVELGDKTLETAVDHAIEIGAEDVVEEETEDGVVLQFTCEPRLLNQVKGKLVQLGYNIKSAEVEFLAKTLVSLNENELKTIEKIFHKLEEEQDIVKISENIA